MLCFGDVNLLFDQARKRFERLLLQVNRSRFDYQTKMLSASLLFLYMPIFIDLLLICVVLFDVIDVSRLIRRTTSTWPIIPQYLDCVSSRRKGWHVSLSFMLQFIPRWCFQSDMSTVDSHRR